ncbi:MULTISPECIES: hypothetical protein [Bacillaceae]|uniref:Uncharacterized protein n=1 Tax=Gottfriedia luciferensis TaxID=178774 RepID=A0ABX2ZVT2_9BACI|nr:MULTISPECIES: hypothetical protein [Bacillaceae]ODG93311.1 hypothetical protein BED47_03205 [Gottfriedia luciferensis]PGZ95035.1 hypothetical protein COE53_00305 [Bacillus sp. AFS029533]
MQTNVENLQMNGGLQLKSVNLQLKLPKLQLKSAYLQFKKIITYTRKGISADLFDQCGYDRV